VALAVFARSPLVEARQRGLTGKAQALFRFPRPSGALEDRADLHLFADGPLGDICPEGFQLHAQSGGGFRTRINATIETLADAGYEKIILVGSDCPSLSARDLDAAYASLQSRRAVIGPDHKGGMYLIGLRVADRRLLENLPWQRNRDFEALRGRFDPGEVALLPVKQDVDTTGDLELLARGDPRTRAALAAIARRVLLAIAPLPGELRRAASGVCRRLWIRRMLRYLHAPPRAQTAPARP